MEPFAITRNLCCSIQATYHRPNTGFCATAGKALRLALYILTLLATLLIDLCLWPLSSRPQPQQQYVPANLDWLPGADNELP